MNGYDPGPSPVRDLIINHLMEGNRRQGAVTQTLMDALMGEALTRTRPSEIALTGYREAQAESERGMLPVQREQALALAEQRRASAKLSGTRAGEIETLMPGRLNLLGERAENLDAKTETENTLRSARLEAIVSRIANDAVNRAYTVARTKTVDDLRDPTVLMMMERAALLDAQEELATAKIFTENELRDPRVQEMLQRAATNAARQKLAEATTELTTTRSEDIKETRPSRIAANEARASKASGAGGMSPQQYRMAEDRVLRGIGMTNENADYASLKSLLVKMETMLQMPENQRAKWMAMNVETQRELDLYNDRAVRTTLADLLSKKSTVTAGTAASGKREVKGW